MDAKAILNLFRARTGPMTAELEHGAGLSQVQLRRVARHGLAFTGGYIPDLATRVTIHVDHYAVEGVISARNDVRASLSFLRPA